MRDHIFTAILLVLCVNANASKYDDARKLYREGPEKAPLVIQLLTEFIAEHPKDVKAHKLLGITQFGTKKNKEALVTFNKTIDLLSEEKAISAEILMLKARTLYALDQKAECKRILRVYWAFWQRDVKLKETYQWYWEQVKEVPEPKLL